MIGRNPENYLNHVIRNVYNDFQLLIDEGLLDTDALLWLQQKLPPRGVAPNAGPSMESGKADIQASSDSVSEPKTSSVASKVATLSLNQSDQKSPMVPSSSNVPHQGNPSTSGKASSSVDTDSGHPGGEPPMPPPPSYPHAVENSPAERVVALYNFPGPDAGDLPFRVGDIILVKDHINNDWWRGSLHGREGIFPSNYVSVLDDAATKPPSIPPVQYISPGSSSSTPIYPPPNAYPGPGYAVQQPPAQQPVIVAQGSSPKKHNGLKKLGSNVGNAFVFGAGATAGADLVNSIF
ncbi:wiskott-Aldrich syndrome binding protein Lsb1 [Schizosaccharomyces cryophilus OY26]|uniref:Wiskott-Aldrich syndrome binding protein Lsb1 n=1 Tax=Schizosaccharomyces cryophilus (strain OY26 / ATCC MYA-4695 / CBS 11777 / NBRC 106824 / NRRL Y48691) TaxID=653667 RepID=S9X8U0_SCHCR|nr:wiskott-Aldrich syndrome binding protein Lsb1 [Schizosaccharomyces cryophilus OY26]EPY53597.1 wiskott-Aldrich syndrome binding protein Lsb1 [Schizosaccharomyces cryophilus OY26]